MNRTTITLCLFLFFTFKICSSFSQIPQSAISGYVVTAKGDTLRGFINPGGDIGGQQKVRFYDVSKTKIIYTPDQIVAYSYYDSSWDSSERVVYERRIMKDNKNQFLYKEISGQAKLYKYYYLTVNFIIAPLPIFFPTKREALLIEKGDSDIILCKKEKFKTWCSEYFSDYPELSKKIANKEYKRRDINRIIDEYNKWYSLKK